MFFPFWIYVIRVPIRPCFESFITPDISIVQFYSLTSSQKGYGRKIVEVVVRATPDDWDLVVTMDWSGGFWDKMLQEYPRIIVF